MIDARERYLTMMLRSPEPDREGRGRLACVAMSIWTLLWVFLGTARAEGEYEGMWETGPTRVSVSIQSWGEDCGVRPRSKISPAGGKVRITQSGHRLIIHSRDRALRSDGCWSPNPALRRASSSFLDGIWNTICNTPPDDPKSESGEYSLRLEGKNILYYRDVSRYNWELKDSTCVAIIITTQKLTRVGSSAAAKPETAPESFVEKPREKAQETAQPEELEEACQPGPPERLLLRPRRTNIEPGRRVCFRARVVDGAGCTVPGQKLRWSLRHSPGLRGFLQDGCFRAAASAAEAEGDFRVVASASGLRSPAVVSVRPMDLSGLIAKRIESGAVSGFEQQDRTTFEGEDEPEESAIVGVEVGKDGGSNTMPLVFAAITVLGLIAVAVAFKILRRPRSDVLDAIDSDEKGRVAAPSQSPAASPTAADPAGQWICPKCRRGYPREKGVCPSDGAALLPYERFASQHRAQQDGSKRKRCPKCGEVYPATIAFCGNDGSALEKIS